MSGFDIAAAGFADILTAADGFGEDVTYRDRNGIEKDIRAMVERIDGVSDAFEDGSNFVEGALIYVSAADVPEPHEKDSFDAPTRDDWEKTETWQARRIRQRNAAFVTFECIRVQRRTLGQEGRVVDRRSGRAVRP